MCRIPLVCAVNTNLICPPVSIYCCCGVRCMLHLPPPLSLKHNVAASSCVQQNCYYYPLSLLSPYSTTSLLSLQHPQLQLLPLPLRSIPLLLLPLSQLKPPLTPLTTLHYNHNYHPFHCHHYHYIPASITTSVTATSPHTSPVIASITLTHYKNSNHH